MENALVCEIPDRRGKTCVQPFFLKTISLHLFGFQDIPLLLDHSINCLTSASDLSDASHTGDIKLESSAYLANTGSSKRFTSRSLRKLLNKCGPLTLPWVVPLFTTFHSPTNPLLLTFVWVSISIFFCRKLMFSKFLKILK